MQDGEQLLEMMRGYKTSSIIAVGVDLDIFGQMSDAAHTASEMAVGAKW